MNWYMITLIGMSLSLDAFTVSLAAGGHSKSLKYIAALQFGIFFGIFQAFMPVLGYCSGTVIEKYLHNFEYWVAFLLLFAIGIKMIYETLHKNGLHIKTFGLKTIIALSIATSIDALIIGTSFAIIKNPIKLLIIVSGITTFILSFSGVLIGNRLKNIFGKKRN